MAVIKIIRKINEIAALVALGLLSLFVIMQVFARYALGAPLSWSEELSRYLQIWMVMLGAAIVMRKGKHLAIDVVTSALPPIGKKITDVIAYIGIIVFFAIVFYQGIGLTMNAGRQVAPATGLKMSYVYAALPVGSVLILMETIIRFVRFLRTGDFNEKTPDTEK